jgi:alkylation response protein AidB-like acyl-CoA dehydrogenase
MYKFLSDKQNELYAGFKQFVEANVVPNANSWDDCGGIPRDVISLCASKGYLGSVVKNTFGGMEWDYVTFGLLNEAFGYGSSSLTGLITVQTMVSFPIQKFGYEHQKEKWLPKLASGEIIGAFAITEPDVGSNINGIQSSLTKKGNKYFLNGQKKWISFSGIADILLVFCQYEGNSIACIVETKTPGVNIQLIKGISGFKSSYISSIEFDNCEISEESIVGKKGLALRYIAPIGFHYGRLSTAWSATGLIRACLQSSALYSKNRKIGSSKMSDFGLIRQMVTDMGVDSEAAFLLCLNASKLEDNQLPEAIEKTLIAKYFSSKSATKSATNAFQIFGANGCSNDNNVARYYRDSKLLEILEGTTQVHQNLIGKSYCSKAKS